MSSELFECKIVALEIIFYFLLIFIRVTGQQIILEFCLHRLTYECQVDILCNYIVLIFHGGVSCMPAALFYVSKIIRSCSSEIQLYHDSHFLNSQVHSFCCILLEVSFVKI